MEQVAQAVRSIQEVTAHGLMAAQHLERAAENLNRLARQPYDTTAWRK